MTYLLGAMVNILYGREPAGHDRDHRVRIALAPATPAALHHAFRERFGVTLVGSPIWIVALKKIPATAPSRPPSM